MGACCAQSMDENTRNINAILKEEEHQKQQIFKLLFLGSGGSGKSTIFKQLQYLHGTGFTKNEALELKEHIYEQTISQMKYIINIYYGMPVTDDDDNNNNNNNNDSLQHAISIVQQHQNHKIFTDELADAIQYIWKNEPKIQNVFKYLETTTDNNLSHGLDATTEYFWNEIDRTKSDNYIPTEADIINVRCRSVGIIDKMFKIQDTQFNIFDVGGQVSERRKWINCFNEVTALVFVVSLSCFNENMFENATKNAMVDSLELCNTTINNKHFKKTKIILFLNKTDLYKKKIINIPITECPAFDDFNNYNNSNDFNNPNDYQQTIEYIKLKFLAFRERENNDKQQQMYVHLTCAMDTQNIQRVFDDIQSILLNQNLKVSGY